MIYMSQNFRLFHVSNLTVLSIRIVPLMYPGFLFWCPAAAPVHLLHNTRVQVRNGAIVPAAYSGRRQAEGRGQGGRVRVRVRG